MEVAAHEFSPALHDQNECDRCSYGAQHPVHSLWARNYEAFVDVGPKFVTKDSGKREEFDSGMVRDTNDGKPRYDLLIPEGIPEQETMLYRWAMLMYRGSIKYQARNWEKSSSPEEMARFKESAFRHFMAWFCGDLTEDHACGILFNVAGYETTKWKVEHAEDMRDSEL